MGRDGLTRGESAPRRGQSRSIANPQAAPQAAFDPDRSRGVFHKGENASAHVAPIGLQEEGSGAPAHRRSGLVLVDAAVPSIGGVPNWVRPVRFAELRIVGGDQKIMVDGRAEDHALIQCQHRITQWSERSIEKLDVVSHVLLWIGGGDRHEVFVEKIGGGNLRGSNRRCEARLDLRGDLDSLADEFGIDRLEPGTRRLHHDAFAETENPVRTIRGGLQGRARFLDRIDEPGHGLGKTVAALGDIARLTGDLADFVIHIGDSLADQAHRPSDRVCTVHDNPGARYALAALRQEPLQLAAQLRDGSADLSRGLAGLLGQDLDIAGDDRETASRIAGTGRLDGRVQGQHVGLPSDAANVAGNVADPLHRHFEDRLGCRGFVCIDAKP